MSAIESLPEAGGKQETNLTNKKRPSAMECDC